MMKLTKIKKNALLICSLLLFATQPAIASPIASPAGKTLKVHWAVVEAKPGTMDQMLALGAKDVAPYSAKEDGTYAIYGAVDKNKPEVLRLLEIYESEEAYQVHRASLGFKLYQENRAPILAGLKFLEVNPIVLEQKNAGTASVAKMELIDVKPENLPVFEKLITKEMQRAVQEDDGVMGLFATAEKDRPNMVHTLALFKDEAAYNIYMDSTAYKTYLEAIKPIINESHLIENQPTAIPLSAKGLVKNKFLQDL